MFLCLINFLLKYANSQKGIECSLQPTHFDPVKSPFSNAAEHLRNISTFLQCRFTTYNSLSSHRPASTCSPRPECRHVYFQVLLFSLRQSSTSTSLTSWVLSRRSAILLGCGYVSHYAFWLWRVAAFECLLQANLTLLGFVINSGQVSQAAFVLSSAFSPSPLRRWPASTRPRIATSSLLPFPASS